MIVCGPLEIDVAARTAILEGEPPSSFAAESSRCSRILRATQPASTTSTTSWARYRGARQPAATRARSRWCCRLGVLDLRRRLPPRAGRSDSRIAVGRGVSTNSKRKGSHNMSNDRTAKQELAAFGQEGRRLREQRGTRNIH